MDTDQSAPVTVQKITADVTIGGDLDVLSEDVPTPSANSWTEQWVEAQLALREIEQATDADAFRSSVESFFTTCWQISDWIEQEPTLPAVDRDAIGPLLKSSLPLTVCNSFANKLEHKASGIKATAKLERITIRKDAWRASIIYIADERTHTFDALALAKECMDDWRGFLVAHGATPPGLP